LWQPVEQLRLGWEVMWGQYDWNANEGFCGEDEEDPICGTDDKADDIRLAFGAWFFF
jgi:hypothetical protein